MMIFDNEFELGETVYHRMDTTQEPMMIIGIKKCIDQTLLYEGTSGRGIYNTYYPHELSKEKNKNYQLGIEEDAING